MRTFLVKFATVASGSALGQLAAALASPVLARVFTPEDYGASGVILSVVMILVFVSTLRYDDVIIAGKTMASRDNAVAVSLTLLLISSCAVTAAVLVLARAGGLGVVGMQELGSLTLFVPVILVLNVLHSRVMPPILVQFEQYRSLSLSNFLNGAMGAAAQIIFGAAGLGALGLLLGRAIALGAAVVVMASALGRRRLTTIKERTTRRQMRRVLVFYRRQALLLAPAGVVNTVAMQLPVLALATVFGTAAAGAFFFTQTLANATLSVYRRSITALTVREARSLRETRQPILPFMTRVFGLVSLVAVPTAVFLFLYGEALMPIIFGGRWAEAGTVVKWMGIFYAASAIHLSVAALSTLLKFQQNMLVTQAAQLASTGIGLGIGVYARDLELAIALVGVTTALVYVGNIVSVWLIILKDDRSRESANRVAPSSLQGYDASA